MPSDLATALISGNNNAMLTDPTMAAIAPQLQLAQALTQSAISTAPAYPAQAAARLAQALAGVKINADAQHDLSDLSSGATGEMGKIFPEGTPIGDGLRSHSGLVRMLAMQQAGKAMLLNSEGQKLAPEQSFVAPGTPRTGGGVMATGQPALAGATEAAKNPALIARAGGEAAVKAPYEVGGKVTVPGGPSGLQEIPATTETIRRMQPGFGPPNVQPVAPNQPGSTAPIAPKPVAPVVVKPSSLAQPAGAPKDQAQVPPLPATAPGSFQDRYAAVGGQPVKTPEFQGEVKGREELYGAANKAIGGVIAEHIEAGGKNARDRINALDSIESALQAGGGKGIVTGPHAESILRLRETLDGMGIKTDWITKGMPESEITLKMNGQLASAASKAMTPRPTQFEFASWQKLNPGLATSREGTLALIDILRQQAKNDIDLGRLAQNKKNWDNWPEVVDKFAETHGLTDPLTGKPMRDEIAATKGAPSAKGPQVGAVVNGHRFKGGDPNKAESWEATK